MRLQTASLLDATVMLGSGVTAVVALGLTLGRRRLGRPQPAGENTPVVAAVPGG